MTTSASRVGAAPTGPTRYFLRSSLLWEVGPRELASVLLEIMQPKSEFGSRNSTYGVLKVLCSCDK